MKSRLEMGKIVNTVGIKGELKVVLWCDDYSDFLRVGKIHIRDGEYTVEDARPHKAGAVLRLREVQGIEAAEALKNEVITADRELLGEPPDGSYYIADLLGLMVYTDGGELLGELTDWLETGRRDVYIVKRAKGRDVLLPAIPEVIKEVDIKNRRMTVTLLEGLVDEDEI